MNPRVVVKGVKLMFAVITLGKMESPIIAWMKRSVATNARASQAATMTMGAPAPE